MTATARYGPKGPIVNLAKFIDLQGGETDPKKWTVRPICKRRICRAEMKPYDIRGAVGFPYGGRKEIASAAKEITERPVDRAKIGFQHKPNSAHPLCRDNFAHDPRFVHLNSYVNNPRVREYNKTILMRPAIRRASNKVLNYLMRMLTGHSMNEDERQRLAKAAEKIYGLRALRRHYWILPFLLVVTEKHHTRLKWLTGGLYKTKYQYAGTQRLNYLDVRKESATGRVRRIQRILIAPRELQLSFVLAGGRNVEPERNQKTQQVFNIEVSRKSWRAIAQGDFPIPLPPSPRAKSGPARQAEAAKIA